MTSKLVQMQARFQQKQMQEKEERLLKLYESQQQRAFEKVGRGSAGSNNSNSSIGSTGGGKVRQMFDERRQRAGIDKSYPLEPLKSKTSSVTSTNRSTAVKSTVKNTVTQKQNDTNKITHQKVSNNSYKRTTYEEQNKVKTYEETDSEDNLVKMINNHNLNDLDSENFPEININGNHQENKSFISAKLANVGGKLPSQKTDSKLNGTNSRNSPAKPEAKIIAKKPVAKPAAAPRSSSSISSASSQSSRNSPSRTDSDNMASRHAQSGRAPTNQRPSSKQTPKSPVVRDDLTECRFCSRRFATDRLGVHEEICGKTGKKKRKAYDATKHRVQGTELETYVIKGGKKGGTKSMKITAPKTNWRRTHEEFIAAIRAAKQAQAYVAKGGKLADLPPPPPSSNPDYVQCPHCGRRFNEAAAQRHVPKCATYDFNKPKPKGKK